MRGTFNIYCSVAVVTKLQVAFETCPATCPGASYCRCPPLRMSDFYELLFTSCVFVPCLPRVVPPLQSGVYHRARGQAQLYEHDKSNLPGAQLSCSSPQ